MESFDGAVAASKIKDDDARGILRGQPGEGTEGGEFRVSDCLAREWAPFEKVGCGDGGGGRDFQQT